MASSQPPTGYGPSGHRSRLYFDGNPVSYPIWETRFLNFLYTQDKKVHKAILPKPPSTEDETTFADNNRMAYAELVQVLDEKSLLLVLTDAADDGRKALHILRQHFASTEKPRVLTLYEELTTLHMMEHEDITDYIIRGERAATGLRTAGEQISDNLIIAMLLKGLPESFKPFVVVHTQLDKVKTLAEFKSSLHNYASTEAMRTQREMSTAMFAQSKPSPIKCVACGKMGHAAKKCRSKDKIKCAFCGKPGHVEAVCRNKRGQQPNAPKSQQNTAHLTSSFSFLITTHAGNVSDPKPDLTGKLLVDCGATSHIVNHPDRFTAYDSNFNPANHFIELADGTRSNELVKARGDAVFYILDAKGQTREITLKNSLFAPSFPTNLFSVRAAVDSGAQVTFSKSSNTLSAGDTDFNIVKEGQLYFLPTTQSDAACAAKSLEQWHKDLGHMNYTDIMSLPDVTKGMNIIKTTNPGTCNTCTQSKMTVQPKSQDETPIHATRPLERVHTDVAGPITPTSREGHNFIINFVDEYTSMIFVYFLRAKSESHTALKKFLSDVAPIGQVLEIHADNGGEYIGQKFQDVLMEKNIKFTTTAPHSAYQNGKAERSWRSLLEMARCLILDAQLPKYLWSYAVRHSSYLRNRSYQRRTKKTAYELFTGIKPDMRKINTFGAMCTYYNEGHKRKLDARGSNGYYLGVNTSSQNSYYVLTTGRNQVLTTRNVTIHSNSQMDDIQEDYWFPLRADQARRSEQVGDGGSPPDDPTPVSHPATNDELHTETADNESITSQSDTETADKPDMAISESKPTRERKPNPKYKDYVLCSAIDYAYTASLSIPQTYQEAMSTEDSAMWKEAMDKEINSLVQNDTWEIAPLPKDRKLTKGRWVYALKQGKELDQIQYKARYVAKGFSQVHGVDYFDTYSPTTRFTSIRSLLQIATNEDLMIHQLDVKGAYLNADIDTDIYLEQPAGYIQTNEEGTALACHLKKSLYGLKQSGRNWHITLTDFLKSEGYTANENDPCVYTSTTDEATTYILFWVDDILIAGKTEQAINKLEEKLEKRFNMDDRGELRWFLGIDFNRLKDGSYQMSQERYTDELLKKFNMSDCNPVKTPAEKSNKLEKPTEAEHQKFLEQNFPYRQAIGSLMYLMTGS